MVRAGGRRQGGVEAETGGVEAETEGAEGEIEGAEAEIGVGRGGIEGIHMVKRGHIGDIDRGIDLVADRRIGRERGIRIGENGRGATIGEGGMSSRHGGDRSGATPRKRIARESIHEIGIVVTEDDDYMVLGRQHLGRCLGDIERHRDFW